MKKVIWIVILILVGLTLIWSLNFLYKYLTETEKNTSPTSSPTASTPAKNLTSDQDNQEKKRGVSLVSEERLAGYWFDADNRLYLIKASGEIININKQEFIDLNTIKSAPDGEKILVNYGGPTNVSFSVFDVVKNSWSPLPQKTLAAAWHPVDSNKLIYLQDNLLKILNLKTNKSETVLRLNLVDIDLTWSEEGKVLITNSPSRLVQTEAWELNLKNKSLINLDNDFDLLITQNNQWRLKFLKTGIFIQDIKSGQFLGQIPLTTIPDKCLIDKESIYCAIPQNINKDSIWPDDYLKRKLVTSDDFYKIKINLVSKKIEQELVFRPEIKIDAADLKISDNKIYFLNKIDNKLYSLKF